MHRGTGRRGPRWVKESLVDVSALKYQRQFMFKEVCAGHKTNDKFASKK